MLKTEHLSQDWDTLVVHTTHGKQPLSLNREEGSAIIEGDDLLIQVDNVPAQGPEGQTVGTVSVREYISLASIVQFTLIKKSIIQPVPSMVGIRGEA